MSDDGAKKDGAKRPLPRLGKVAPLNVAVADELEARILDGEWPPGLKLPAEPELGEQLGVSRSVVRDAMKTLSARGLVEVRQGAGTVVSEPSDEAYSEAIFLLLVRSGATIGEAVAAREAIDLRVAELAAGHRTQDDIRELERHYETMRVSAEQGQWTPTEEAHLRFHVALLDATQLPVLSILLQPMQRLVVATDLPPGLDDPATWDIPVHGGVLEAVRNSDVAAARAAMRSHYAFAHDAAYAETHALPFGQFMRLRDKLLRGGILGR